MSSASRPVRHARVTQARVLLVPEGRLGGGHRLGIVAEAVVQHGVRPLGNGYPDAFAAPGRIPDGGLDQGGCLGLVAAQCGQGQGAVRREVAPRRLGHRLLLIGQCRRGGQVASEQQQVGAGAEGERKLAERARRAGQLDVPTGEHVPALVVPQMQSGRGGCQRQPAQLLVGGHASAEGVQRLAAGAAPPPRIPRLKFAARPSRSRSAARGACSGRGAAAAAPATSSVRRPDWPAGRRTSRRSARPGTWPGRGPRRSARAAWPP